VTVSAAGALLSRARAGAVGALLVVLLAACGSATTRLPPVAGSAVSSGASLTAPSGVAPPPVNGQFDYQLGGAYQPTASVTILDRDRSDPPVAGKYNICYLNAFQTQAEDDATWKAQHPEVLLASSPGKYVEDPDWPGEILFDTSSPARRATVAAVVDGWIDGCAASGFQAVEPDNLDSWTRSGGRLNEADNLALAVLLVEHAHQRGLAVAQKNTGQLGSLGQRTAHFDFAIAEECQVYLECQDYTGPYGDHVIEIEYTDNGQAAYRAACAAQGKAISVILRDRDVVPQTDPDYRYEHC
jgi:hypothetical protein